MPIRILEKVQCKRPKRKTQELSDSNSGNKNYFIFFNIGGALQSLKRVDLREYAD